MSKRINNVIELFHAISGIAPVDTSHAKSVIEKAVYKGTMCGAWIKFADNGVIIGSAGVDGAAVQADIVLYPFPIKVFWDTLLWVNETACAAWDEDCTFSIAA